MIRTLVGDIGGTKALFAEVIETTDGRRVRGRASFESARFDAIDALVRAALAGFEGPFDRACLALPGPVRDGACVTTNLPWVVRADALARAFPSLGPVTLVNDFVAVAYGVATVDAASLVRLTPGAVIDGAPRAILGPGTGLGEATIVYARGAPVVLASEGGHKSFGPRDAWDLALYERLAAEFGHVSVERVASGMGLANWYALGLARGVHPESPSARARIASGEDRGAVIATEADAGDPLCAWVMERFVRALANEASNAALHALARGGVYLAGGVAQKNVARLRDGVFALMYADKGRLSPVVAEIPVFVVLDEDLSLRGAAVAAG
jgi:glucokinase